MKQFSQVVQAAGDGALVGMRVLQVLIRNVGTSKEGAFSLFQVALVHQDDSRVQVGRCQKEGREDEELNHYGFSLSEGMSDLKAQCAIQM